VTRQLSDVEILIGELLAEENGYEKSLHLEPIKKNIALCVSCFLEIQNSRYRKDGGARRALKGLKNFFFRVFSRKIMFCFRIDASWG